MPTVPSTMGSPPGSTPGSLAGAGATNITSNPVAQQSQALANQQAQVQQALANAQKSAQPQVVATTPTAPTVTSVDASTAILQSTGSKTGEIIAFVFAGLILLLIIGLIIRYKWQDYKECKNMLNTYYENKDKPGWLENPDNKDWLEKFEIQCQNQKRKMECEEKNLPKYVPLANETEKLKTDEGAKEVRANVKSYEDKLKEWKERNKCNKSWAERKYADSYEKSFEYALVLVKVGFLLILLFATVRYQYKYAGVQYANTYFGGGSQYAWRPIIDALTSATLAALSVIFVLWRRGNSLKNLDNWKGVGIVFAILFIFVISQESSGFNRWVAEYFGQEFTKQEGNYYKIDSATGAGSAIATTEAGGDPFVDSFSWTCMVMLLTAGVVLILFVMFPATFAGYKSGEHSIADVGLGIFVSELAVMAILNGFAPALSPVIRGEPYTTMSYGMIFIFILISVVLHLMFQWNGLYDCWTPYLKDFAKNCLPKSS